MRRSGLIKVAVGLVALGGLGVLFVRSARSVRAEPFEVARDRLARWTLALEPPPNASGVVLALRPQRELASALFNQVFARTGESLSSPVPAEIPLVLQSEFAGRVPGTLALEALLDVARMAGLESPAFEPRCMAHRRVSQPGTTRQLYFVLFEWSAFDQFRRQLVQRMRDAGGSASAYDPNALSPVLIVAATDAAFSRWLPLRADADEDCFAPIALK